MKDLKDSFKVLYQFKTDYLKVTLLLTILQAFVIGPFIISFSLFSGLLACQALRTLILGRSFQARLQLFSC